MKGLPEIGKKYIDRSYDENHIVIIKITEVKNEQYVYTFPFIEHAARWARGVPFYLGSERHEGLVPYSPLYMILHYDKK